MSYPPHQYKAALDEMLLGYVQDHNPLIVKGQNYTWLLGHFAKPGAVVLPLYRMRDFKHG